MRKLLVLGLLILCGFIIIPLVNATEDLDDLIVPTNAQLELVNDAVSAVLLEASTKTLIYEKNSQEKRAPASMTKIMTMILVMEALEKGVLTWEEKLAASENAVSMGGTQIYLEVGEEMTVRDLLKSVAIASANDAAVVLAEKIGGSLENFLVMMNSKAVDLGLTNTHFKNPNGLPEEGHYSCAYDMALMGAHLVNNYGNDILQYTNTYEDYVRQGTEKQFWLVNTNKLIKFVPEIDGIKTGWTEEAGYCLTATIIKDGVRYVAVTMGNSTSKIRNQEIVQMLNYATSNYEIVHLYKKGDIIEEYENINIKPNKFGIVVSEDVNILKKKGSSIPEVSFDRAINDEKIKKLEKDNVGLLRVYVDGKLYKETTLCIGEEIKKSSYFSIVFKVFKEIFLIP